MPGVVFSSRLSKKTEYLCSLWFFVIQSLFADRNKIIFLNKKKVLYRLKDIDFLISNLNIRLFFFNSRGLTRCQIGNVLD